MQSAQEGPKCREILDTKKIADDKGVGVKPEVALSSFAELELVMKWPEIPPQLRSSAEDTAVYRLFALDCDVLDHLGRCPTAVLAMIRIGVGD